MVAGDPQVVAGAEDDLRGLKPQGSREREEWDSRAQKKMASRGPLEGARRVDSKDLASAIFIPQGLGRPRRDVGFFCGMGWGAARTMAAGRSAGTPRCHSLWHRVCDGGPPSGPMPHEEDPHAHNPHQALLRRVRKDPDVKNRTYVTKRVMTARPASPAGGVAAMSANLKGAEEMNVHYSSGS